MPLTLVTFLNILTIPEPVVDLEKGTTGTGPLKFDWLLLFFKSHFVSECLKIRLR